MKKIQGHGRPTVYTEGMLGQFYVDLDTGNVYECRRSSKYSPTHGAPVGGYQWELRATGEDIREHMEIHGSQVFDPNNHLEVITWDGVIGNKPSTTHSWNMKSGSMVIGTMEMSYVKVSDFTPDVNLFKMYGYSYTQIDLDGGEPTVLEFKPGVGVHERDGFYNLADGWIRVVQRAGSIDTEDGGDYVFPETGLYYCKQITNLTITNTVYNMIHVNLKINADPVYQLKPEHLPMLDPIYGEVYDRSFTFDGEGRMEPDIVEVYGSGGYAHGWFKLCNLEDLGELTDDTEFRVEFSGSFAEQYGHQPVTYKFGDRALYDWWENDTTSMKLEKLLFIYEQVVDRFDHVAEPGLYGYTSISAWDNELIGSEYVSKVCIGKPDIKVVDHKIKESYIPESVTPFVIHINGELPSPDFTGEYSEYIWTIDKTIQEIADAIDAGRCVTATSRLPFKALDDNGKAIVIDYLCLSVLINPYHNTTDDAWDICFSDYYNSYYWRYENIDGSDRFYYYQ